MAGQPRIVRAGTTHGAPFKVRRRWILGAIGGLVAAVLLAACAPDEPPVAEPEEPAPEEPAPEEPAAPTPGGTLTVGLPVGIEHINPVPHGPAVFTEMVALAMYDTLFRVESDGSRIPRIAEEWEMSDDRLVTTFRIREGVEFHDGRPLTAEDVAYSIGLRIDPDLIQEAGTLSLMDAAFFESIDVLDERTVQVTTTEPFRLLDVIGVDSRIVPADAHEEIGDVLAVDSVGTGPFKVENFVAGSRIDLVPNENYWDGRPPLDNLNFVIFDDFGALASNFRAGDVDALWRVQAFQLPDVVDVPGKQQIESGFFSTWWMPQMGQPPLDDPAVRRALRYAFDMDQINAVAFAGEGTMTWSYLDQTEWASGVTVDIEFDPDRAADLLAEAGASDISIPIVYISGDEIPTRQAAIIQEGLRAAGVDAELNAVSAGEWFGATYGAQEWEGLAQNTGTPFPFPHHWTLAFTLNIPGTSSAFMEGPPVPEVDRLLAELQVAEDDRYNELMTEGDRMILEDALTFTTPYAPTRFLAPDNMEGLWVNDFGHIYFDEVHLR